ncbi:hypothetical protein [Dysosmobacter sp.]|uniref:hypothetical protein n=1 Tax=Dysosmobacter sp. TaxID=2591382 RepID=UPI002A8A5C05|nr:hypothetical protein [Dysosmobacter sp.]MDY3282270.1 hypothetical protein [Dysosmobacter sp.]
MSHPRSRKDTIQNLLIVLLSLSALLLLIQTGRLFSDGSDRRDTPVSAQTETALTDLSTPLAFAVSSGYGRYGEMDLAASSEAFAVPGQMLREALGSAGALTACPEAEFRQALDSSCAYYDFGITAPLSVLAGLVGAEVPPALEDVSLRWAVLSAEESGVALYLTNGADFRRCSTQVAAGDLSDMIGGYPLGNALFACELEDSGLAPYTLLLTEQHAYPPLTAENPLTDQDQLLSRLGFNPRTNFRYTESNGTLVVQDGDRALRIHSDGSLSYESGGSDDLSIAAASGSPGPREAVLGAFRLLDQLFPDGSGLCLEELRQEDGGWVISFGYQFEGVRVRRASGRSAAQVTLEGTEVTSFTLWPRQYTADDGESLLLPLTQALAIARSLGGRELSVRYTDSGGDTLSAQWLAE